MEINRTITKNKVINSETSIHKKQADNQLIHTLLSLAWRPQTWQCWQRRQHQSVTPAETCGWANADRQ